MNNLPNDVLMKIITTISEDKNKEIFDLENKLKKLHTDLEKEKLKISNIKDITYFHDHLFCCDFCCKVYSWNEKSLLFEVIEPYICINCQINPIYTQDILSKAIVYTVENYLYYYPTYDAIPKRYKYNPIFTIKKYYYNDIDSIFEDISYAKRSFDQAEKEIIKNGAEVYLDYRNNIYFEENLIKQRNIIYKKYKN